MSKSHLGGGKRIFRRGPCSKKKQRDRSTRCWLTGHWATCSQQPRRTICDQIPRGRGRLLEILGCGAVSKVETERWSEQVLHMAGTKVSGRHKTNIHRSQGQPIVCRVCVNSHSVLRSLFAKDDEPLIPLSSSSTRTSFESSHTAPSLGAARDCARSLLSPW